MIDRTPESAPLTTLQPIRSGDTLGAGLAAHIIHCLPNVEPLDLTLSDLGKEM